MVIYSTPLIIVCLYHLVDSAFVNMRFHFFVCLCMHNKIYLFFNSVKINSFNSSSLGLWFFDTYTQYIYISTA